MLIQELPSRAFPLAILKAFAHSLFASLGGRNPYHDIGPSSQPATRRLAATLLPCILLCGCDSGDGRRPLYGKIAGAEGRNGSITLIPAEGQRAPSAMTRIVDGTYEFTSTNGPMPAVYDVTIRLRTDDAAKREESSNGDAASATSRSRKRIDYETYHCHPLSVLVDGPLDAPISLQEQ